MGLIVISVSGNAVSFPLTWTIKIRYRYRAMRRAQGGGAERLQAYPPREQSPTRDKVPDTINVFEKVLSLGIKPKGWR